MRRYAALINLNNRRTEVSVEARDPFEAERLIRAQYGISGKIVVGPDYKYEHAQRDRELDEQKRSNQEAQRDQELEERRRRIQKAQIDIELKEFKRKQEVQKDSNSQSSFHSHAMFEKAEDEIDENSVINEIDGEFEVFNLRINALGLLARHKENEIFLRSEYEKIKESILNDESPISLKIRINTLKTVDSLDKLLKYGTITREEFSAQFHQIMDLGHDSRGESESEDIINPAFDKIIKFICFIFVVVLGGIGAILLFNSIITKFNKMW